MIYSNINNLLYNNIKFEKLVLGKSHLDNHDCIEYC